VAERAFHGRLKRQLHRVHDAGGPPTGSPEISTSSPSGTRFVSSFHVTRSSWGFLTRAAYTEPAGLTTTSR
jgi:hypothetical protein